MASPEVERSDFEYAAFVSYSTDADYALARRVQAFLEQVHKLRTDEPLPKLKLCRDGSDFALASDDHLSATVRGVIAAIEDPKKRTVARCLGRARCLVVLCAGAPHYSDWMRWELDWFRTHRPDGKMYVVATRGFDPWRNAQEYFPTELVAAKIHEHDFGYDLRGARPREARAWHNVRDPEEELVRLAANLMGRPPRDVALHWERAARRRAQRIATLVGAVAISMLVLAVIAWTMRGRANRARTLAEHRRNEADQSRHELARRLALNWFRSGHASLENDHDTLSAFLSAARSLAVAPDDDPNRPSYFARLLALTPSTPSLVMTLGRLGRAAIAPDHGLIVLQRIEGSLETWDTSTGLRLPSPIERLELFGGLVFSDEPTIRGDGKYAALVTPSKHFVGDLRVLVWEVASGRAVVAEPAETIFSPTFGPEGWVARREKDGLRLWNLESTPPMPRDVPGALSLAPDTAPRALVAVSDNGLRFADAGDATFTAGPFLIGEPITWHGWTKDGRLLVFTRRASTPNRYWCTTAGCSPAELPEVPSLRGLTFDQCGAVFGPDGKPVLVAAGDVIDAPLPDWPSVGRLCAIGDKLVALSQTFSGQWRTFGAIIECEMSRSQCGDQPEHERRGSGGFVAAEWQQDRERLLTLSSGGLALSWPAIVASPGEDEVELPPPPRFELDTRIVFDRAGRLAAVAVSDHTGVSVIVYSITTRRWLPRARIDFPTDDLPSGLADDPLLMRGALVALRFNESATRLLIGVQGDKSMSLTAIDPKTGEVTMPARATAGHLEDAMLNDDGTIVVVVGDGGEDTGLTMTQMGPSAGPSCRLPTTSLYAGLGRDGKLVFLQRSDGVEVWSLASCRAISKVSAPAADWGTLALIRILLTQADAIHGGGGQLQVRLGVVDVKIVESSGTVAISHGAVRLQVPPRPADGTRQVLIAVSPDVRRLALVEIAADRGPSLQIWDLEMGLRISGPDAPVIEGQDASTSLAIQSRWGAAFAKDGEEIWFQSRDRRLKRMYIGPTRLPPVSWIHDLSAGVTGLELGEDGRLHPATEAAQVIQRFRTRLEAAAKLDDPAAQALLRVLSARH